MSGKLTPIQQLIQREIEKDPNFEKGYREHGERLDTAVALMRLREELGLSQRELAQKSGKAQSTIARIENGKMNVSFQVMSDIAHAVGKEVKIEFV